MFFCKDMDLQGKILAEEKKSGDPFPDPSKALI
jgi:hypothetical protein